MKTDIRSTVDRILKETIHIQQIPAPTFSEKERSDYVFNAFIKAGLDQVEQDDIHNVYARIPGSGNCAPVVITAHLDTVFGLDTDLATRQEDNRIYGPGIGDNSLSVAVLIQLKEIVENFPQRPDGDFILVANSCEEGLGDLAGIRRVVEKFSEESPKAYIVLEGTGIDRLYVTGVGSQRYRISVQTRGGHSWIDFGQPSAVHSLMKIGNALSELTLPAQFKTTLNIGVIDGGRSVNTIADRASLLLDLRSIDNSCLNQLVQKVTSLVESFKTADITIDQELIGQRPAGKISEDSPLVNLCRKAYTTLGLDEPELKAGSTDANIPLSMGIPTICLGLTHGENTHLETEFIETEPLYNGIAILAMVLEQIWEI